MNKELLRKAFEAGEKYSGNIEFGEYAETFEVWYENQAELNHGVIGDVMETPEEAFDRGYTAGMSTGAKLMGKGSL